MNHNHPHWFFPMKADGPVAGKIKISTLRQPEQNSLSTPPDFPLQASSNNLGPCQMNEHDTLWWGQFHAAQRDPTLSLPLLEPSTPIGPTEPMYQQVMLSKSLRSLTYDRLSGRACPPRKLSMKA